MFFAGCLSPQVARVKLELQGAALGHILFERPDRVSSGVWTELAIELGRWEVLVGSMHGRYSCGLEVWILIYRAYRGGSYIWVPKIAGYDKSYYTRVTSAGPTIKHKLAPNEHRGSYLCQVRLWALGFGL